MSKLIYTEGKFYVNRPCHDYNDYGHSWTEYSLEEISLEEARLYEDFYSAVPLDEQELNFFESSGLKIKNVIVEKWNGIAEVYEITNGNYVLYLEKKYDEYSDDELIDREIVYSINYETVETIKFDSFNSVMCFILNRKDILSKVKVSTKEEKVDFLNTIREMRNFGSGVLVEAKLKDKDEKLKETLALIENEKGKYLKIEFKFIDVNASLDVQKIEIACLADIRLDKFSWNEKLEEYEMFAIFKNSENEHRAILYSDFKKGLNHKIVIMPYIK